MEEDENKIIKNWRDEHGEPDFSYLESLRVAGDIESLEKMQSIASDLDVDFSMTTTADELMDLISVATEKNEDGNVDYSN